MERSPARVPSTPLPPPHRRRKKTFLLTDRSGNVIYSDHSDGIMLALLLSGCQKYAKKNFGEKYASGRGQGRLVLQQLQHVNVLAAWGVDADESTVYVRSLCFLLHELLILLWGSTALQQKNFALSAAFHRHRELLPALIATTTQLCDTQQAFLLKALEMLEVNADIRAAYYQELKTALKPHEFAGHALVFVGTKLLTVYSRPRAFELTSTDVLLLALLARALFEPAPTAAPPQWPGAPPPAPTDEPQPEEEMAGPAPDAPSTGEPLLGGQAVTSDAVDSGWRLADLGLGAPDDDDDSARVPFEPRHTWMLVHLRARPAFAYVSQLARQISIVIVSTRTGPSVPEEADAYGGVRDQLRAAVRDSFAFLTTKERTHVSMLGLPYVFQLPGLVHFMYVDRTRNRVYAPAITPLHGQESALSALASAHMSDTLQRRVWRLVSLAQSFLAAGYSTMVVRGGELQYAYRLWLEDEGGSELPLDKPLAACGPPLHSGFYDQLARLVAPTVRNCRVLELYTLYIAPLSFEQIAAFNHTLVAAIKRNNS